MSNAVGEKFNLDTYQKAREKAIRACEIFSEKLAPGMTEKEGISLMDEILLELGSMRKWHPTKFRYAEDTTKSFRDKSELQRGIKESDLYFLDIGPVFDDHEADIGRSYGLGCKNELGEKAKKIFKELEKIWKENQISGKELYERALILCQNEDVVLNPKMAGHRLGDFPHALHYKGNLISLETSPHKNLWVLEIHILDKNGKFGSFYEDILT